MKDKKLDIRNILEFIGLFLIFLYPFNATITHIIYKENQFICLASIIIGLILLIITRKKAKITKKIIPIIVGTISTILVTIVNNYYIIEGRNGRVLFFIVYLFLPLVLYINKNFSKNMIKVLKLFSLEHIIGTYIGVFFKTFYQGTILPYICGNKVRCVAVGNFYHGYIPGFTTHFSTNGIYLATATILFFAEFMRKKDKKTLALFIISIIALFTSGKRGQLLISIFACILLYIAIRNKKTNIIKKTSRLIFAGMVSVVGFIFISKYIPEMTNIIVRFESLLESGDVLNGRGELYSLAFDLWSKHILIGNGWGSFSYYYQIYLYNPGALSYLDAHNVYIQLLCEVGIVGLLIYLLFTTIYIAKTINNINIAEEKNIYYFAFMYSVFFILYSFSGNPLYDPMCYVIYFACISLCLLVQEKEINKKYEEDRNNNIF